MKSFHILEIFAHGLSVRRKRAAVIDTFVKHRKKGEQYNIQNDFTGEIKS